MIYTLLYPLSAHEGLGFLNVLRYVPFRVVAATVTAMFLTFGLYPWFIRRLRARQIGQVVRHDGPATHLGKAGTPTMGGALVLLALGLSTVAWAEPTNAMVWTVMGVTAAYGLVGWLDDAAKIRRRSSGGLSARVKLALQIPVAAALCAWLFLGESGLPADWLAIRTRLAMPFVSFQKHPVELPAELYVVFATLVIVATSNAVNLTDGLDGLAIGPVMINAGTYLLLAYLGGLTVFGRSVATYLDIPPLPSAGELAIYCGALLGAGMGFLWYNAYPAQVFMGDVGSLALGGGLGAIAVCTKNELVSVILGGIFVLEAVSVLVQVVSYRLTGRRVFLMAPIHHHFEKKGWAEPKVIVRFWIVAVLLALVTLGQLKLR
ncbi:MAG: phospho-N-acetylmuramoyl-pentapeptide-transferase [Myxococcota bacterium]|nr:phospho-N-acetylmuramoyl-pentapeptide-transferase [Myxococcota bacterium]MDW8362535.1 phospho-N-acetylmuramoyl-pentapeptide-transferase [Myxococcales bacterium]